MENRAKGTRLPLVWSQTRDNRPMHLARLSEGRAKCVGRLVDPSMHLALPCQLRSRRGWTNKYLTVLLGLTS